MLLDFNGEISIKSEQDLWRLFKDECVDVFGAEALDFGVPKSKPEIIVFGYAYGKYSENGKTAVSVSINNVKKDLWVNGDRFWEMGKPTKPSPFDCIPISKFNSYGGKGYLKNPVGKGRESILLDGVERKYLANVENPNDPFYSENKDYETVSLTPIPIEYPGRNKLLGTYDQKWREQDFPGFAKDIDWSYFNQAPIDQRLYKLENGDQVTFTNLHPEESKLTFTLPDLEVLAFFKRVEDSSLENEFLTAPLKLELSSIWAFPHLKQLIVINQGSVITQSEDDRDFSHCLLAIEEVGNPKSSSYYEEVFKSRDGLKGDPINTFADFDLIPEKFLGSTISLSPSAFVINSKKRVDAAIENVSSTLKEKGYINEEEDIVDLSSYDNHGNLNSNKYINPELVNLLNQDEFSLDEYIKTQRSNPVSQPSKLEIARDDRRRKREIRQIEERLEILFGKTQKKLFEFEDNKLESLANLKSKLDNYKFDHSISSEFVIGSEEKEIFITDVNNRNNKFLEDISKYVPFDMDEKSPQVYGIESSLDFQEIFNFSRNKFLKIENLTINEIDISSMPLMYTLFIGVHFKNVNFSNSILQGIKFQDCKFENCVFNSNKFNWVYFEQCEFKNSELLNLIFMTQLHLVNCNIVDCKLKSWSMKRIVAKNLNFEKSELDSFTFIRGLNDTIGFYKCNLKRVSFVNGRLNKINLVDCTVDSLAFVNILRIKDMSIKNSNIEKLAITKNTLLIRPIISHSKIKYSGFRESKFLNADISNSFLDMNDFSETEFVNCKLSKTSLRETLFPHSVVVDTIIEISDFAYANFQGASLKCNVFKEVSFFSVQFSHLENLDNVFNGCLTNRANFVPKREPK
ncbi:DUF2169 family type VI secretion system accessory protein [Taylorella equigenitalis]|uniref:DUF2169 family type VI secretion system accessory protein n=1 Tax=Taylorella equigenitalis TaxID=29575 RepID=UPI00237DD120|nr:DUF2169 domain-containing protein [Taylorella equigenitalis]